MKQATDRVAANWRRLCAMPLASIYPSYVAKAEKKGRTRAEVDEIFRWLTGHSQTSLEAALASKTSFEDFFAHAPKMNPSRSLITGVVCGVRVEEIQEPMMRETYATSINSSTNSPRARRWKSSSADNRAPGRYKLSSGRHELSNRPCLSETGFGLSRRPPDGKSQPSPIDQKPAAYLAQVNRCPLTEVLLPRRGLDSTITSIT